MEDTLKSDLALLNEVKEELGWEDKAGEHRISCPDRSRLLLEKLARRFEALTIGPSNPMRKLNEACRTLMNSTETNEVRLSFLIEDGDEDADGWWCASTHKISPPPTSSGCAESPIGALIDILVKNKEKNAAKIVCLYEAEKALRS